MPNSLSSLNKNEPTVAINGTPSSTTLQSVDFLRESITNLCSFSMAFIVDLPASRYCCDYALALEDSSHAAQ